MPAAAPGPAPVVVGFDGSGTSVRAARHAAEAARRRGAPLRLVHAALDVADLLGSRADRALETLAASLAAADPGTPTTIEVEQGSPVDVLRAASAGAQLLVLGGQGAGGTTSPRVGATAGRIAASAACPVVVVPDDTTALVVRGRRSVVVGVDGRPGADPVLGFAFQEADTRGTDLVAVHTWRTATPARFESDGPRVDWAAVRADEERMLTVTLAGWQRHWPGVAVREVIARGPAARSLLAAGLTAELLVIGHRTRGPFSLRRSTARTVLRRATGPVAVVRTVPGGADGEA